MTRSINLKFTDTIHLLIVKTLSKFPVNALKTFGVMVKTYMLFDGIVIQKHDMHNSYTAQSTFPIAVKCLQNVHLFMF